VPVWGSSASSTVSAKLAATGAITLSYDSVALPSAIVGVSKGGSGNSAGALGLSALMQSSWSYGTAGSVHAFYQSSDPFGLAGKSVTFSP
jgi:hypothetical protein